MAQSTGSSPPHNSLKLFLLDLLRLLWWSFLYPTKLVAYMQTLHPDLTARTSGTNLLALIRHTPGVRRFVGLQITLWLWASMLGIVLIDLIVVANNPAKEPSIGLVISFSLAFGLIGMIVLSLMIGVTAVISLSVTLVLAVSIVSGVVEGTSNRVTTGLLLTILSGVALGAAVGVAGPVFDRLQRPTINLSSFSYWGYALVGVVISGVAASVATAVTVGLASGIVSWVVGGIIFSLASAFLFIVAAGIEARQINFTLLKETIPDGFLLAVMLGTVLALEINLTIGVAGVIVDGLFLGILISIGDGLAIRAGNGLSAILTTAGLAGLILTVQGGLSSLVLLTIVVILLVGLYSYVRFPIYLLEILWIGWTYWQARRNPEGALLWLRRSPVYWDELIFYPLPLLDRLLLLALRHDPHSGLQEAEFIARSFRQGWAANRARLAFAAEILAQCASPAAIASAPAELDWLADEVMLELKQGTAEVIPRLLAIAQGVKATLEADNPYSRRLGYREALEGLETLQRRLPSLGQQAAARWQPVIEQWQKLLLDTLDIISATVTTGEATTENPYQPGNPLQLNRKELFKGRKELREAVVNALLERNRPTLVLHGPRRMGKTSFLLQLPALLPGNTLPVFLDLQRPALTQDTAAFLFHLARSISRDARPYRLIVEPPQRAAFDAAPFEAFAAWLEDVALPALQDFNLLITFDEFENLGKAVELGRLDTRIFDELRYLIQHQTRLALLFAGVQTLDELGPAWSSYFINIKPLTIGYLTPTEAAELIRAPDPGADFRLSYNDTVITEIMTLTRCQPYLLQLLCSAMVEESNARATLHADAAILEAALVRALDQGEPYFRNVWDEMGGADGQPWLRQIAASPAPLSLPESASLTRLVRRRVLTRTETGYTVEIPLVRRWIVERAP